MCAFYLRADLLKAFAFQRVTGSSQTGAGVYEQMGLGFVEGVIEPVLGAARHEQNVAFLLNAFLSVAHTADDLAGNDVHELFAFLMRVRLVVIAGLEHGVADG